MTEFLYKLTIAEKIAVIRKAGFIVKPRTEAQEHFNVPDDEPGAFVIFSPSWVIDREVDGMSMSGDDALLLEVAFAEAWCDDEWGDIGPVDLDGVFREIDKARTRRHLRVVQ